MDALNIAICGVAAFRPTDQEGLDLEFRYSPLRQKLAIWRADAPDAERWRSEEFK